MNFTLTLSKINLSDIHKVGSRALDLAICAQNRIPVVSSFVVPHVFFEEFLSFNGLDVKLQKLTSDAEGSHGDFEVVYNKIKFLFSNSGFPPDYLEQLRESYEAFSMGADSFDVSSLLSKKDERVNLFVSPDYDLPLSTFKGVFLNICGFDNFICALKSCWLAMFCPEMLKYRLKLGIKKFSMGVVVQSMYKFPFTCEVDSGSSLSGVFVFAYKGLLDITNSFSKDEFLVRNEYLELVDASVVRQEFAILASDRSGILIKRSLGSKGDGQKLSNFQIKEAARLCKKAKSVIDKDCKAYFSVSSDAFKLFLVDSFSSKSDISEKFSVDDTSYGKLGGQRVISKKGDVDVFDSKEDFAIDDVKEVSSGECVVEERSDYQDDDGDFSNDSSVEEDKFVVENTIDPDIKSADELINDSSEDDFILDSDSLDENSSSSSSLGSSVSLLDELKSVETLLVEKVYSFYRSKYGDEPLSLDDALARLAEYPNLVGLREIGVLKNFKESILNGEFVEEDSVRELINKAKEFPGGSF
ncbi:hypothetical protein K9L97_00360 [Candidatus Woesearchaeota archaeon]|nr:hypothetical protein [Candidatus Woesearchaeota archaeon]